MTPTSSQNNAAGETSALWRHIFGDETGILATFSGLRVEGRTDLQSVKESYYDYPGEISAATKWLDVHAKAGREVYFCAHLLSRDADGVVKRQKPYAAPVLTLWSDSDQGVIPEACPPTLILETSPGRHHSFWRLTHAIDPETAESLNKRLAALCGVKNDGADLTQLLRPAGYPNYKYPDGPITRILETHGETYDPGDLGRLVPSEPSVNGHRGAEPIPDRIPEGMRNEMLTSIAGSLRNRGLGKDAIEAALAGVNQAQCDPPLTDEEVATIAGSVARYDVPPAFHFTLNGEVSSQTPPIEVPAFPVAALPEVGRRLVEEGAAALNCPPDLIAVPLLAMTAGVIGNTQKIQLKASYTQRPILWTAVIAEPGTAKSPA
jgi:hypothetical protein